MKKKIKDNSGYTLVELIIVLAIIVILTSAAFITMSVMHTAKVKEAATTFDAEVTDLIARSRNQQVFQDLNNNGLVDAGEEKPDYRYVLALYKSGNKFYVKKGIRTGLNVYSFAGAGNGSASAPGKNLSSYVRITYTDFEGHSETNVNGYCFIEFDKTGACVDGAGVYKFYKKNGSLLATVTINKNGSHQIR